MNKQEVINKENEVVFEIVNTKVDGKHKQCPKCFKIKRNKCFVFNRILKKDLCFMCNKSVGSNPFYNKYYGKIKNFVSKTNLSGE